MWWIIALLENLATSEKDRLSSIALDCDSEEHFFQTAVITVEGRCS